MDYKIDYLEKFNDKRGQLVVFLKKGELKKSFREFGQIYFVTFDKKGEIRGNHYHKKFREWFGIVNGKVEVVLVDVKTNQRQELILDGDSKKYTRLEIGPNIIHAFRSISRSVSLLNYTDKEWSSEDVFRVKIIK